MNFETTIPNINNANLPDVPAEFCGSARALRQRLCGPTPRATQMRSAAEAAHLLERRMEAESNRMLMRPERHECDCED